MNINAVQLSFVMQCSLQRASRWVMQLNSAMQRFDIDNALRQAHFLAQIGHESGGLVYVRELASGSAYEGRQDLGNTYPGDGVRYKGRGLIQITGRTNYKACGDALGIDFEHAPMLLETPNNAAMSAAWFWHMKKLNALADADDVVKITKRINGGINGLDDRIRRLKIAKRELGVSEV